MYYTPDKLDLKNPLNYGILHYRSQINIAVEVVMEDYQSQIFVSKIGLINVNKSRGGYAYDAQGNTYQKVGERWVRICCPKKEVVLTQSLGSAPMSRKHSVSLVR